VPCSPTRPPGSLDRKHAQWLHTIEGGLFHREEGVPSKALVDTSGVAVASRTRALQRTEEIDLRIHAKVNGRGGGGVGGEVRGGERDVGASGKGWRKTRRVEGVAPGSGETCHTGGEQEHKRVNPMENLWLRAERDT